MNGQVAGWHSIAVGIGTGIRVDTLHDIAGKNGDVIIVKSFDLLITQLMEVKNKICGRSPDINRQLASKTWPANRTACFFLKYVFFVGN